MDFISPQVATDADIRCAVRVALLRAGKRTFYELKDEADSRCFSSERARLAWMAIKDLEAYA